MESQRQGTRNKEQEMTNDKIIYLSFLDEIIFFNRFIKDCYGQEIIKLQILNNLNSIIYFLNIQLLSLNRGYQGKEIVLDNKFTFF